MVGKQQAIYNPQRISLALSSNSHGPLFPDDNDYCYFLRCSKNNAKGSEASAETADGSENHEESPQRRRKRAMFKDFEEIVVNVIGKLS